jgi:AcrR family transcriptional regulator
MNEKITDRRIQRTRHLLLDALNELILEKGYEAMTVQDIIDRANVGRSTFYSHFQDKEDLLLNGVESLWVELEKHLRNAIPTEETIWTLCLSMFEHAQGQRSLYKALVGNQGGNLALKHIQKQLYELIYEHLKFAMSKNDTGMPPEILAHYFVSSFIALLTWWLDNDTTYSAQQMNNFYRQLIQRGVEPFFETKF